MNAWKKNAIECAVIAPICTAISVGLFWRVPQPDWVPFALEVSKFLGILVALISAVVAIICFVQAVSSFVTWSRSQDFRTASSSVERPEEDHG